MDAFDAVIKDADSPKLDGWELLIDTHGIKIYRFYRQQSKLYEYKVIGNLEINAELFASVYMDIDFRKTWDSYAKELKILEKNNDAELIYWEVAYPWPLANRDYIYTRRMKKETINGKDSWIILAKSTEPHQMTECKEKKGVIRVTDYVQCVIISDAGKDSMNFYMQYYDDPKGNIPTMIINWAAKTGVPGFMTNMEKACRKYAEVNSSAT